MKYTDQLINEATSKFLHRLMNFTDEKVSFVFCLGNFSNNSQESGSFDRIWRPRANELRRDAFNFLDCYLKR